MSMEQYGQLMINYQHDISQVRTVNRSASNHSEGNIDWTNECVFECKLCQPGRKFNSKVRNNENIYKNKIVSSE